MAKSHLGGIMSVKYEFKKLSKDDYELNYEKNGESKTIKFKQTIDIAKTNEEKFIKANLKINKALADEGMTQDDLIIKKVNPDGTETYDEKNFIEFRNTILHRIEAETIVEILNKTFGMSINEIFAELEIDDKNEAETLEFFKKYGEVLKEKNPCQE
jgi:hypothetical protein